MPAHQEGGKRAGGTKETPRQENDKRAERTEKVEKALSIRDHPPANSKPYTVTCTPQPIGVGSPYEGPKFPLKDLISLTKQ
ncbi:hypothetical protein PM082_007053 [Marasmius tenuissimus]|nr:hypothetical protein PM082_007053 [Marasmius tenuissimus]